MPPEIAPTATLRADLDRLADAFAEVRFDLAVPDQSRRREMPRSAAEIVRRYLLRRLRDPDGPLLVAVFGPTGAGKSTILNSLAGATVSEPGAVRPTTRRPVVWCHRRNVERATTVEGDPVVVTDDHPLLETLTIVDTPDLDSYMEEHRAVAESVLRIADAAVFVTTPQRYADAVPWEVVGGLVARDMPLIVVANRLSRRSTGAVADLTSLLRSNGLETARTEVVLQIQEHRMRGEGRLPKAAVERLRQQLAGLPLADVTKRTVRGTARAVARSADETARLITVQAEEGQAIWRVAEAAFEGQIDEIALHLERGELVRGEVVARWRRMLGVTDLAALAGRGWARVRDVIRAGEPLRAEQAVRVGSEARDELVELTAVRAQRAISAAVLAWELEPGARDLLSEDLRRTSVELEEAVRVEIDEWMAGIVSMLSDSGRSRYRVARLASVGVNGAATLLLLGVFASTGGLTGAEAGVAAGAAAAQQTLLEHLFGSAAASSFTKRARTDLTSRLARVLRDEASRFLRAVEAAVDPPATAERLSETATRVRAGVEALDGR